jgi:hypothetical protein
MNHNHATDYKQQRKSEKNESPESSAPYQPPPPARDVSHRDGDCLPRLTYAR